MTAAAKAPSSSRRALTTAAWTERSDRAARKLRHRQGRNDRGGARPRTAADTDRSARRRGPDRRERQHRVRRSELQHAARLRGRRREVHGDVHRRDQVTCADAVISPGLINPHDHITFARHAAASPTRASATSSATTGARASAATPRSRRAGTARRRPISRWGELRFLMGGATSTVGSGGAGRPAPQPRHDRAEHEGLDQKPVDFDTFPLGDSRRRRSSPTRLRATRRRTAAVDRRRSTTLPAAHLRGHRRRRAQRVPLPDSSDGNDRRTISSRRRPRSSTASASPPRDYAKMATTRDRAHLVAALQHHALRQHRAASPCCDAPGRADRARHRLDAVGLDEPAARAALRRHAQHRLTSTSTSPTSSCG